MYRTCKGGRKAQCFFYVVVTFCSLLDKTTAIEEISEDPKVIAQASSNRIKFLVENNELYKITNVTCTSAKQTVQGNENAVCDNLYPCTLYSASVSILELMSDNTSTVAINVNTTYATPDVTITELRPDKFKIFISWEATNNDCVSQFMIEAKSSTKTSSWEGNSEKKSQELENLNPCEEYSILFVTLDKDNVFVSNISRSETTLYAEPENVLSITSESTSNGLVKISWEPPTHQTCIDFYNLKWSTWDCIDTDSGTVELNDEDDQCQTGDETLSDPNAKEFVISGLQGCDNFGLLIFINDDATPNSEIYQFTSPHKMPGLVKNVNSTCSSTEATIIWEKSENNPKCIANYVVNITGPMQRSIEYQDAYSVTTNITEIVFPDLDPCGAYDITITALSVNGTANIPVNYTLSTSEAKPTQIRNCSIRAEPKSLIVSWEHPEFGDLCLNGYRLSGWIDENITVNEFDRITNDTNVTFSTLISCQVYTIQIIPTTMTMDGDLIHIDAATTAVVVNAPTALESTGVHSQSLELSARDNDFTNKCTTMFAQFACEAIKNVTTYKYAEEIVKVGFGDIRFKAILAPLSPNSEYRCWVSLFNSAGWSKRYVAIHTTAPYYPETPQEVTLVNATNSSLQFQWQKPKYSNGNIKVYKLYFQRIDAAYYIPPKCYAIANDILNELSAEKDKIYNNIQPSTIYSFQVAADNEYGTGNYTLPFRATTKPWISEPVTNLQIESIVGPDVTTNVYKANATISWQLPCKSNGNINRFDLEFFGIREGFDPHNFSNSIDPIYDENAKVYYSETRMKPEYKYKLHVYVVNNKVKGKSVEAIQTFQAPSGIPNRIEAIELAKVDAFEARNPTISAVVRFPLKLLKSESGTILYAALLVSQKGCESEKNQLEMGAIDSESEWPNSSSWSEVNERNFSCILQYQTTPIRWVPYRSLNRESSEEYVEYTIGTENCDEASSLRYCNGPLKTGTEYNLVIRLFTKSAYNDAALLHFKTDSMIKLTIILISIISCLLLAFITGFIYLWVTKRIIWHRESCHGIADSFGDVVAKNFAIFYNELSKPEKLQREFKELTVVASDLSVSASESNDGKNRYADIFPYDKNRVILDIDAEGSDYINASFINGYRRKKEYIATQGPKPESLIDFWRMVLQHNIRVIAMVTQFREGDVTKCHVYFPMESKEIKVVVKKLDTFDLYDRREIIVTHAKQSIKRKIIHFYYKKWPDHGCPTDPINLINFIRKVKAEKLPSFSPIVVHCSAGVGRTGTFIALDIIMQKLKSESKINIYETVKELRFQRMKMVQTMEQYTFLYACAFHLVKHKIPRTSKYSNCKRVTFPDKQETDLGAVMIEDCKMHSDNNYFVRANEINIRNYNCDPNNTESEM